MASPFDGPFTVYRIASENHPIFDGGGAFKWGGRWSTPGRRIIHTASTYSLALLENLVHWNIGELPPGQMYVTAEIPGSMKRTELDPGTLPGWASADYVVSQRYGDNWYDAGETPLLIVPSVLSPFERNILVNQRHPEFRKIRLGEAQAAFVDPRLIP